MKNLKFLTIFPLCFGISLILNQALASDDFCDQGFTKIGVENLVQGSILNAKDLTSTAQKHSAIKRHLLVDQTGHMCIHAGDTVYIGLRQYSFHHHKIVIDTNATKINCKGSSGSYFKCRADAS